MQDGCKRMRRVDRGRIKKELKRRLKRRKWIKEIRKES